MFLLRVVVEIQCFGEVVVGEAVSIYGQCGGLVQSRECNMWSIENMECRVHGMEHMCMHTWRTIYGMSSSLSTYIYIYTYVRTYVRTYLPTYLPTYIHTYIHTLHTDRGAGVREGVPLLRSGFREIGMVSSGSLALRPSPAEVLPSAGHPPMVWLSLWQNALDLAEGSVGMSNAWQMCGGVLECRQEVFQTSKTRPKENMRIRPFK